MFPKSVHVNRSFFTACLTIFLSATNTPLLANWDEMILTERFLKIQEKVCDRAADDSQEAFEVWRSYCSVSGLAKVLDDIRFPYAILKSRLENKSPERILAKYFLLMSGDESKMPVRTLQAVLEFINAICLFRFKKTLADHFANMQSKSSEELRKSLYYHLKDVAFVFFLEPCLHWFYRDMEQEKNLNSLLFDIEALGKDKSLDPPPHGLPQVKVKVDVVKEPPHLYIDLLKLRKKAVLHNLFDE